MDSYKVLVSTDILKLPPPARRERELILSFLEKLGNNPAKLGDYEEKDEAGRPVQIKIIGGFALIYLTDHVVKETKVTRIETASPK